MAGVMRLCNSIFKRSMSEHMRPNATLRFPSSDIRIVPAAEQYITGFNYCVGVVARERKYIAKVDAPPLSLSASFVHMLLAGGGVQMLAVNAKNDVVGWCDIVRDQREGYTHRGTMGMGLLPDYRGRGLGEKLLRATIDAAVKMGIERVELEVYPSNQRAIRLYEKLGFRLEGTKHKARKLDGKYEDDRFMALIVGESP